MDKAKLIDQASVLMSQPVYDVVAIKRRPRWIWVLGLPLVATELGLEYILPILWLTLGLAVIGVMVWAVTETRFLAFTHKGCALLRGRRWFPNGLKGLEREMPIDEIKLYHRTVHLGDDEFSMSAKDAARLSEALARQSPTRLKSHP